MNRQFNEILIDSTLYIVFFSKFIIVMVQFIYAKQFRTFYFKYLENIAELLFPNKIKDLKKFQGNCSKTHVLFHLLDGCKNIYK